jgi:CDP-diacylglycerol--serine O-phosphatidyltransferase
MSKRGWKKRVARRGGLLAHIVTFANLCCGFAAIVLLFEERTTQAVSFLFLAGLLDFLDGALARMGGHGSAFGKELDSLADIVSFGVAPAVLGYRMLQGSNGIAVGIVCAMFVVAGAWRLAQFNVLEAGKDFRGMPITVAGLMMTALAFMAGGAEPWPWPVLAACSVGLSIAMICRIRFIKLSGVVRGLLRRRPDAMWWVVVPMCGVSLWTIVGPVPQVVVILGAVYIVFSLLEDRRSPTANPVEQGGASG